ncbi:MAG: hypothetical protein H0T79_22175 [Deltaproteobacteria bacterium]|nr:hypothetical protein [Deltaproteobacteria bacterium]
MRSPALLVMFVSACTTPHVVCPTPPVVVREPPAPVVAPPPLADARPTSGAQCWAKGRPTLAPPQPATDPAPSCNALDMGEHAKVEARVRKEFVVYEKPSKLVVDFGCDVASEQVREVVFEDGSGHGGSLRIVRFRREPDSVIVRMIDSAHYRDAHLGIRTATVDLAKFDALIASSRVALLARPHLIRLVDPKRGIGIGGGAGSSNDFHLALAIIDLEGKVTAGQFTGYSSSLGQERSLPLRLASAPIEQLLAATTFRDEVATDADRQMFMAQFTRTMRGDPYWWVKERYVALAAELGTLAAVPTLVALLDAPAGASEDRTRAAAVDAIIALTGWNARLAPDGSTRSPEATIAAVRADCAL